MFGKTDKEFLIRVKADLDQTKEKFSSFEKELVRLELAGRKAGSGLNRTQKELRDTERAAEKASRSTSLVSRGLRAMAAAGLTYLSLHMAADLLQTADNFNILQDRIRTATRQFGDYNTASRELFAISQRNGTSLEASVELFQRLARSAPSLKATQDEVLAVTNAVSQLGIISGATNDQLKFGLLQLGQAFSYPIVQAQEINSVLENIPEVAVRIEKGLGLMPGTLKQAVNEGRILGKDIFNALLSQTSEINKQFEEIPTRLSRSTQRFGTAFASILSDVDKTYRITSQLADLLDLISNKIKPVDTGDAFLKQLSTEKLNEQLETTKMRLEDIQRLNAMNLSQSIVIPEARLQAEQSLLKLKADLLKEITHRTQEANAAAEAKTGGGKSGLTEEQKRAAASIKKTIEALELEAATLGKTRTESALYELQLRGATDAQLKQAEAALQLIDAHDKQVETQRRVKEIIEATRTPAEQLALKMAELNTLYRQGQFGAVGSAEATETLRRAIAKAKDDVADLGKQGKETFDGELTAAVRGWGDTFTNTLTDMVVSGKGSFKELANAIIRDLVRIFVQTQITLPLLRAIFPGSFPTPAGTASVPNVSVPVQHAGGMAGSGPLRMDSPLAYLNAPRHHTGLSFVGLKPDEHRAILQTGERVLSREQNQMFSAGLAMGGGSGGPMDITLNIQNKGTPQQAVSASGQFDGKQFVINVMTEDQARNGPITQGFSRTFSLRRKPPG